MKRDMRRAERVPVKLSVSVRLFDGKTDTVLAGPVQGEARDFSPLGLALSLASVRLDRYHLFFTCQDNPDHIMKIAFQLPEDPETVLEVPARPVWYDLEKEFEEKRKRALFGLEFLLSPKDPIMKKLVEELFSIGKAPSSWLEKLF